MSTHCQDLPALLCQLGALGRENWYTGMLAAGGVDATAGVDTTAGGGEPQEIENAGPAGPWVDEIVDLLTIFATVPEDELSMSITPALLARVRLASKKASAVFETAHFPREIRVNTVWYNACKDSNDTKANYILDQILQLTKTQNPITSITSMPGCLTLYEPDHQTKFKNILTSCPGLKHLNLRGSGIWSSTAASLAEGLQTCSALTRLNMSYNRLAGSDIEKGFGPLLVALRFCPKLSRLNLKCTEIDDDAVKLLAQNLPRYPALKFLDISENDIQDNGITNLIQALPQCMNLIRLDMYKTNCQNTGQALVETCLKMNVVYLNLSYCVIHESDVAHLQRLSHNSKLFLKLMGQRNQVLEFLGQ